MFLRYQKKSNSVGNPASENRGEDGSLRRQYDQVRGQEFPAGFFTIIIGRSKIGHITGDEFQKNMNVTEKQVAEDNYVKENRLMRKIEERD